MKKKKDESHRITEEETEEFFKLLNKVQYKIEKYKPTLEKEKNSAKREMMITHKILNVLLGWDNEEDDNIEKKR